MKYFSVSKMDGIRTEITRDQALDRLLGSYQDNAMTRDVLNYPQTIPLMFSYLDIVDDE